MALTTITWKDADGTTITALEMVIDASRPPALRQVTLIASGDDSFTDGALSEVIGAGVWDRNFFVMPDDAVEDAVAFIVKVDPACLPPFGDVIHTLRVTSGAVTADLPVTIKVVPLRPAP